MRSGGLIEVAPVDASKSAMRSVAARTTFESPSWICLSIEDNGVGIPANILPGILQPFVSTKDPSVGTGLGLATCYAIVSAAGGFIDVTSRPGRTRFEVWLPSHG